MSHLPPERFAENAKEALGDVTLRRALKNATGTIAKRRGAAVDKLPEWEALRERARRIKEHVLEHLDTYLVRFEKNALAAGAIVHWADDAEAACRIIGEIAGDVDARTVVKAKSMTSEEIELNDYLATLDIDAVETDLGEWIIQLAGETPSHIIVPAIHKTKRQIADLFHEKVGSEVTEDEVELTRTARRILRRHFAEADLGVSGVNFAIAETGTIHILENEGNIRMTTSMPKVHVALMGIEKIIPRLEDLAVFWRLLPRSGTGQALTAYQSLITGVKREGGEGPESLHIVILDNGRSSMLKDEVTRQSLACIRCGACMNACPVYKEVGGHAYGSVYPGPIGAVITPHLQGLEKTDVLPFASSLCSACRDACPVKIDIPKLLLNLRARIVEGGDSESSAPRRPWSERFAFRMWARAMASPGRYGIATGFARLFAILLFGDNVLARGARHLVPPLRAWRSVRRLDRPAATSFRDMWAKELGR